MTNAAANIAILVGACSTMALSLGLVWRRHRTFYMSAWFLAYSLIAVVNLALVWEAWWGFKYWIALLANLSSMTAAICLWEGMRAFVGAPPRKPKTKRLVVISVLTYAVLGSLLVAYQPVIRIPIVVLILASWIRVALWQRDLARAHGYLGARLGQWVMVPHFVVMMVYPAIFYIPWLHDVANLAHGILLFLAGLALLIMVFERAQAELQHLKDHLEAEVERRSQDLVAAERLAAIGQVAAGIAHEVKNKLNVISISAALITQVQADADTQAAAGDRLRRAVQDTTEMVREMMTLALPHAVPRQDVDVRQLVRALLPGVVPARIQLVQSWGNDALLALVDPKALEQVVLNVLFNAVEAMGDRGQLTIATDRRDGYVALHIADTGPGLAADVQAHLFEPFYSTKPAGNGLGLAISKRLIEQQGGLIAIDGESGQGTRVTLLLPAGPVESGHRLDVPESASSH